MDSPKIWPKLDRFSGDNPAAWVLQAEKYFDFYNIFPEHRLALGSLYFDGEALSWYRWLFRNKQLAGWDHFVDKLFLRFRKQALAERMMSTVVSSKACIPHVCYAKSISPTTYKSSSAYGSFSYPLAPKIYDTNSEKLDTPGITNNNVFDESTQRNLPIEPSQPAAIEHSLSDLLLKMDENLLRMRRHLANIETHDYSDVATSLADKCEIEEGAKSACGIDRSKPSLIDNSAVPHAMLESPIGNFLHSTPFSSSIISTSCNYDVGTPMETKSMVEESLEDTEYEVFAESTQPIETDKVTEKGIVDSIIEHSSKLGAQVLDEMSPPLCVAKCDSSNVIFINPHDQFIDDVLKLRTHVPDSRRDDFKSNGLCDVLLVVRGRFWWVHLNICYRLDTDGKGITDYLSDLGQAARILPLNRFPPDPVRLDFPFDPGSCLLTTSSGYYYDAPFGRFKNVKSFNLIHGVNRSGYIVHVYGSSHHLMSKWTSYRIFKCSTANEVKLNVSNHIAQMIDDLEIQNYGAHYDLNRIGVLGLMDIIVWPDEMQIIEDFSTQKWSYCIEFSAPFNILFAGNPYLWDSSSRQRAFGVVLGIIPPDSLLLEDVSLYVTRAGIFLWLGQFVDSEFVVLLSVLLRSNLEDKVLIEDGSIVMNCPNGSDQVEVFGPDSGLYLGLGLKQPNPNIKLLDHHWDQG